MLIFIVIIAVLIILLYISITICVTIEDETMLSIKYGFLKFKINLDKPEKPEKVKKKKKPKKEKKPKKAKTPQKEQVSKPKKKSTLEKVKEALVYVKPIFNELKPGVIKIVKCVRFQKIRIKMFVATNDAATTAIQYATTKITVANVVSFLQLYGVADFEQVEINADFISEKSAQSIYFETKFRLLFILHNLLKMIFKIIIAVVKTNSSTKENDYVRKK